MSKTKSSFAKKFKRSKEDQSSISDESKDRCADNRRNTKSNLVQDESKVTITTNYKFSDRY